MLARYLRSSQQYLPFIHKQARVFYLRALQHQVQLMLSPHLTKCHFFLSRFHFVFSLLYSTLPFSFVALLFLVLF